MDLGIAGRSAILIASSRGLGRACAESIAREGVNLVINGRTEADVTQAVDELRAAYNVTVTGVVADATTAEGRAALLAACPDPDIVLLNGEGPSPAIFNTLTEEQWAETAQRSMIAPLLFVQAVLPGMCERGFGRIVAISSAMVKSPNAIMSLSHGPRLGLTGVLKGLSKDVVKHNVTINQLLPERFDTGRQRQMAELAILHMIALLRDFPAMLANQREGKWLRWPQRLLIGKTAVLQFDMRLGEGSGAALALGILRAALECHNGMATFGEAGVSGA